MGKYEVTINKNPVKVIVKIAGVIDEDVDFTKYGIDGFQILEFDLNDIKSINSCGVREWIKWMSSANGAYINYTKCPKVIIDQINLVDGFLPTNGTVSSFYVPYCNDDVGSEKIVLFNYGAEFKEGQVNPPEVVKDEKGNVLEIDVIESKYFKFIQKLKPRTF